MIRRSLHPSRSLRSPAVVSSGQAAGPESGAHPSDPYLVQADNATGVDPGKHFHAVPCPLGDIRRGNPGVQPPGDTRMTQVVRSFHEWRDELVGLRDRFRTFLQSCHQVEGWITPPRSPRKRRPSGAVPKRSICSRSKRTSSGGIGTLRTVLRERPFNPRSSCTFSLQAWLKDQDICYVMAIRCSDTVTMPEDERRADALIAAVPSRACQNLSRGRGARPARVPLGADPGPARAEARLRALAAGPPLAQRPRRDRLLRAPPVQHRRPGLDSRQSLRGRPDSTSTQVRTWRAWYAHITLSTLALAWLAASKAQAEKGIGTGEPGLISYTLPEIRRLPPTS